MEDYLCDVFASVKLKCNSVDALKNFKQQLEVQAFSQQRVVDSQTLNQERHERVSSFIYSSKTTPSHEVLQSIYLFPHLKLIFHSSIKLANQTSSLQLTD